MKTLFNLFMLIIFIVFAQNVFINLLYFNKNNIDNGIVFKQNTFTSGVDSADVLVTYVKNNSGFLYEETKGTDLNDYNVKVGDVVIFRILYNGNKSSIKILSRNGIKIANYYGFIDYISPIVLVSIISSYYFINKKYKKNDK